MNYNIQYPDYNRSILSVSSSILNFFNINSIYPTLKELDNYLKKGYKNIVFLILDCLGTEILTENLEESSFLRQNLIANITTVFPSTTTAATTAFHSGTSPFENGWIGWMPYFKEYNDIIEVFTSKEFYTGKKLNIPNIEESILKKLPLKADFSYDIYSCKTGISTPSEKIGYKKLNILEGCYSMHPELAKYIDKAIFVDVSREKQLERILKRSNEFMLNRFKTEWIPLEDLHFKENRCRERADFILDTTAEF